MAIPITTRPGRASSPRGDVAPALRRCVGREQELSLFDQCYDRAADTGEAAFIVVTGRPGIGKSTVLGAVQQRLRDRGALVIEGRCRPGLLSYRPFLEIIRGAVEALCRESGPAAALERAEYLLHVLDGRATPSPTADDPAAGRLGFFDRVAEVLLSLSRLRPLVIVLHDIDFADPGTLELMRYLGRVLTATPELGQGALRGLLVCNAEHGGALGAPAGWSSEVNLVRLDLSGLDAAGVREYLSSENVVERVLEATRGDPGLLQTLVTQKVESSSPLDGLSAPEQRLLHVLAVFGRALGPETLRLLTALPGNQLARGIASLATKGVVEKIIVDGELRIGFARAGDQSAVYDRIPVAERRELHTCIADYLEQQGEAELEARAGHLLVAGHGARAVSAALAAGQRLEIAFSFERAADLYEKALPLADSEPVRHELTTKLCAVYEVTGQLDRALQHAEACRERAPEDPELALRIAHVHLIRGDFAAARAELSPLLERLEREDDEQLLLARSLADAAWAQYLAGDKRAAADSARRGLELCDAIPGEESGRVQINLQNTLGKIHLDDDEHEAARELFSSNLDWARAAGLPSEEVRALVQLGQTCLQVGDYHGAAGWYTTARDLARAVGEHRFLGACHQHLGVLAERRREYDMALECYQDAVAAWKKVGHRSYLAWVGLDLGKLYLRLGDPMRARAMADLADRLADQEPPVAMRVNLELLRGRIALRECRYGEAHDRLETARQTAAAAGQTERELRALLDLAALHLEQSRPEDALALLVEQIGNRGQAALRLRGLLLWARVEIALGQPDAAKSRLAEALELAEELPDPEATWRVRLLMAQVAQAQGRSAEARRLVREAGEGEARVRRHVPEEFRDSIADEPMRLALRQARGDGLAAVAPTSPPTTHLAGADEPRRGQGRPSFDDIVGRHPRMQQVYKQIERVAGTDALVLVRGESGTGKELIAEALHRRSSRADRPLVKVNCGALVESLLLSELFGHERGAFTGAMQRKKGRFEIANGGTIFLDEIGDISPKTQVALLRVLQSHEFERVGGTSPVQVDVRIICATNRDLEAMVARGTFREDLYYRLRGVLLEVPPLRERVEDIPLLAQHFLRRIARERNNEPPKELDAASLRLLQHHLWPGNVRELENVLRSVSLFTDGDALGVEDFADYPELKEAALACEQETKRNDASSDHDDGSGAATPYGEIRATGMSLKEYKKHVEAQCIAEALAEVEGNITKAAKLLGMKRPRLSQLIKEHDISIR